MSRQSYVSASSPPAKPRPRDPIVRSHIGPHADGDTERDGHCPRTHGLNAVPARKSIMGTLPVVVIEEAAPHTDGHQPACVREARAANVYVVRGNRSVTVFVPHVALSYHRGAAPREPSACTYALPPTAGETMIA